MELGRLSQFLLSYNSKARNYEGLDTGLKTATPLPFNALPAIVYRKKQFEDKHN